MHHLRPNLCIASIFFLQRLHREACMASANCSLGNLPPCRRTLLSQKCLRDMHCDQMKVSHALSMICKMLYVQYVFSGILIQWNTDIRITGYKNQTLKRIKTPNPKPKWLFYYINPDIYKNQIEVIQQI